MSGVSRRRRRAALALALGIAVLSVPGAASAETDGGLEYTPLTKGCQSVGASPPRVGSVRVGNGRVKLLAGNWTYPGQSISFNHYGQPTAAQQQAYVRLFFYAWGVQLGPSVAAEGLRFCGRYTIPLPLSLDGYPWRLTQNTFYTVVARTFWYGEVDRPPTTDPRLETLRLITHPVGNFWTGVPQPDPRV